MQVWIFEVLKLGYGYVWRYRFTRVGAVAVILSDRFKSAVIDSHASHHLNMLGKNFFLYPSTHYRNGVPAPDLNVTVMESLRDSVSQMTRKYSTVLIARVFTLQHID